MKAKKCSLSLLLAAALFLGTAVTPLTDCAAKATQKMSSVQTSTQTASQTSAAPTLYFDDKKTDIPVVLGDNPYMKDILAKSFLPVVETAQKAGWKVTRKKDDVLRFVPQGNKVISAVEGIAEDEDTMLFRYYINQDDGSVVLAENRDLRVGSFRQNGKTYISFSDICDIFGLYYGKGPGKVYLYSSQHHWEKAEEGNRVGAILDYDVYVNDEKVEAKVYEYIVLRHENGFTSQSLVELNAVAKSVDSKAVPAKDGKCFSYKGGRFDGLKVGEGPVNNNEDVHGFGAHYTETIYEGEPLLPAYNLSRMLRGSLTEKEGGLYFYTTDYVRTDIPNTLAECYEYFDRVLSAEDKALLMGMKRDEVVGEFHFGWGTGIRNEFLRPTGSRLAIFFGKKGIEHYDDMSSYIMVGYWDHLHGDAADFDAVKKRGY